MSHIKEKWILKIVCLVLIGMTEFASTAVNAQVALPGGDCLVSADESWSRVERWAWGKICTHKIANLQNVDPRPLDPHYADERRRLSPRFLEMVLAHDPWSSAIPRFGVRIVGAYFSQPVDLHQVSLKHDLWIDRSRFDKDVSMTDLNTRSLISFRYSHFSEALNLERAKIEGNLHLESIQVAPNEWRNTNFKNLILRGANIDGQVNLTGARVTGNLDLDSLIVGSSLFLNYGDISKKVDAQYIQIARKLDLRGASLAGMDLTAATIGGELSLGCLLPAKDRPSETSGDGLSNESNTFTSSWREGSRLLLRNAVADAVQAVPNAWPEDIDLNGFVYRTIGVQCEGFEYSEWRSDTLITWLARDKPYTPQPYEQLASVLRGMGHLKEANDVLYAGRERSRALSFEDGHYWSWVGQSLLNYVIGYGLGSRYFRSIFWVVLLVVIGTYILRATGQHIVPARDDKPAMKIGVAYSFDILIPIIRLRQRHYEIDLQGVARYYFYVHQMMGYVLASFLIAGLSGLTR